MTAWRFKLFLIVKLNSLKTSSGDAVGISIEQSLVNFGAVTGGAG
jgi:hypothetical protein